MPPVRSVYVMHAYHEPVYMRLDEHEFNVAPLEPFEVEEPFYADKLIEHWGPVYGLIVVPTVKDRNGVHIDIDAAEKMAKEALKASETVLLANWVRLQREERVKDGKPVLPPTGRVAEILKSRNIDVKRTYGFMITGDETVVEMGALQSNPALEAENSRLRSELEAARADKIASDARLDSLADRLSKIEEVVS